MGVAGTVFSIVMIGHSLFGHDGPDMLEGALQAGIGKGVVDEQIINGSPLAYNWDHAASAEGINARQVLPQGKTTHVIMTEAVPLRNHTQWSDTSGNIKKFADLAASGNRNTKVYVQETWHSLKSGTGAKVEYDDNGHIPWRTRLDQDLAVWEKAVQSAAASSRAKSIQLIPAGQGMARLHDEIARGRVPGLSNISGVFADDIHLNDYGHYFVTMIQYATITGRHPNGLPTQFHNNWGKSFKAPSPKLAAAMQRIAGDTVTSYFGTRLTQ
ncbi:hypothetical protein [Sulfitobacter sp. R18_1]|uniref:hypothetical protein n=1 Tax=Sulfitobacter sp. R18_1 TaxID=2821104 RepID=UPI001ADB3788|nr:hypothetical protein [Sulfitobacter sp. R18_1]MBO9428113.1 hypothetical protein [Sulfitobacter sp. R18_1]